ncbi:DUF1640 domain-containing protein [uncultured Lamprocystis sp.]|jgi:hypothetical protein|uniref:DUF1640 domain-containing protein n=1 Tax=uncultured Lamprocystis sp. TaxID=543132 RepID=UPI0025E0778B|nr:DUF1640 domain-containing protein [uncultured Lamprocystis sp.]
MTSALERFQALTKAAQERARASVADAVARQESALGVPDPDAQEASSETDLKLRKEIEQARADVAVRIEQTRCAVKAELEQLRGNARTEVEHMRDEAKTEVEQLRGEVTTANERGHSNP